MEPIFYKKWLISAINGGFEAISPSSDGCLVEARPLSIEDQARIWVDWMIQLEKILNLLEKLDISEADRERLTNEVAELLSLAPKHSQTL